MKDEEMWIQGLYFARALDSTVCNAFLWRKKGQKGGTYPKKPFTQGGDGEMSDNPNKPLTKEEKKNQVENLFLRLQLMKANHDLEKLDEENKGKVGGEEDAD